MAFVDGYAENYDENDNERLNFFFMFFHENAFEIRVGDSVSFSHIYCDDCNYNDIVLCRNEYYPA